MTQKYHPLHKVKLPYVSVYGHPFRTGPINSAASALQGGRMEPRPSDAEGDVYTIRIPRVQVATDCDGVAVHLFDYVMWKNKRYAVMAPVESRLPVLWNFSYCEPECSLIAAIEESPVKVLHNLSALTRGPLNTED